MGYQIQIPEKSYLFPIFDKANENSTHHDWKYKIEISIQKLIENELRGFIFYRVTGVRCPPVLPDLISVIPYYFDMITFPILVHLGAFLKLIKVSQDPA